MLTFIEEILLCFRPCFSRLAGNAAKIFCLPLSIQIHDGDSAISDWLGDENVSHVVQMFHDGSRAAQHIGHSLFVLDRYLLTKSMLLEWQAYSVETPGMLHVVTCAKRNCIAYKRPGPYKGRGRRPVRGDAVRLQDFFVSESECFHDTQLWIYGVEKEVRFLSETYLWGKGCTRLYSLSLHSMRRYIPSLYLQI